MSRPKHLFILFFSLITHVLLIGQSSKNVILKINPTFENKPLKLEKTYYINRGKDSIRIESFKFYISAVSISQNEQIVWQENNSYHLVDASNESSLAFTLDIPLNVVFNHIEFILGIDSTTNSDGVRGGALDPTLGMYWTWQTGYIHFKVEGVSNLCSTRKNEFKFHLGGFQAPYVTEQKLSIETRSAKDVLLEVDLSKFMREINLTEQNQIMSPGKEAVKLSKLCAQIFSAKSNAE